MKRLLIILCAALALIFWSPARSAYAFSYEFDLDPEQLSLNHNFAYTWGLSKETAEQEIIAGATLTFTNINNWVADESDILYVHLLDNAPEGIRSYNDSRSEGDYLATRESDFLHSPMIQSLAFGLFRLPSNEVSLK